MDHRAHRAGRSASTRTGHGVLRYVGGVISPEMETPKLLWLQASTCRETWQRAARFFDLPDFLVYRATGIDVRSLCTTVVQVDVPRLTRTERQGRWDDDLLPRDRPRRSRRRRLRAASARSVRPMGERVGGLTRSAPRRARARRRARRSASSIIDAHAGGLGVLGARARRRGADAEALETRLALIGGTSSCHMAVSREPRFIHGVWGPYYSAMVPGLWLTEGGQSATGALIDHVDLRPRARRGAARTRRAASGTHRLRAAQRAARPRSPTRPRRFPRALTRDLHVLPDFHGNRSPRADPDAARHDQRAQLSRHVDDLALLYLATDPGDRPRHAPHHRGDERERATASTRSLACGGDTKNPVFLREHADATGCRVVLPREPEAVLLGSAMLGAVAAGDHASRARRDGRDERRGRRSSSRRAARSPRYHDAKYAVFHRMHDDLLAYRRADAMSDRRRTGATSMRPDGAAPASPLLRMRGIGKRFGRSRCCRTSTSRASPARSTSSPARTAPASRR